MQFRASCADLGTVARCPARRCCTKWRIAASGFGDRIAAVRHRLDRETDAARSPAKCGPMHCPMRRRDESRGTMRKGMRGGEEHVREQAESFLWRSVAKEGRCGVSRDL